MLPGQLFKRRAKKRKLEEEMKRQDDDKFTQVRKQDWRKNEKAPRNTRTEEYMNIVRTSNGKLKIKTIRDKPTTSKPSKILFPKCLQLQNTNQHPRLPLPT